MNFRPASFSFLPPVVKNLIIINGLMFLATISFNVTFDIDLRSSLGLHYFSSELFKPYQLITYMFMHGSFGHLFFNMFAVWMFGSAIENTWGQKRFLVYYILTGIGASLLHYGIVFFEIQHFESLMSPESISYVRDHGAALIQTHRNFVDPDMANLNGLINGGLVGASGSLFGILLAFGMLFPNTVLYMMFIPVPIKAKYFVAMYGAFELFSGLQNSPGDNVAHFAHLGGMLFGYILIRYWKSKSSYF
ncbi:MAG: rhomboid family intramembrane serine protease [Flavobacteriales bacterium]|nr:rhomboid family intramembrane serine protease [Flavobacteriales bacterium]